MMLCTNYRTGFVIFASGFHRSCLRCLDQYWRMNKGLTENPNAFGPLTNRPDYTFKDGRPTPLGSGQRRRILQQKSYAEKIVKLVGEIDYAIKKHEDILTQKELKKQEILNSKLIPKGNVLLENALLIKK
ncbi:hypothetical protein KM043_017366 [Ampulex compressa]|nr:hypothetical protein KM043_017366 [Ampulex compressa]